MSVDGHWRAIAELDNQHLRAEIERLRAALATIRDNLGQSGQGRGTETFAIASAALGNQQFGALHSLKK